MSDQYLIPIAIVSTFIVVLSIHMFFFMRKKIRKKKYQQKNNLSDIEYQKKIDEKTALRQERVAKMKDSLLKDQSAEAEGHAGIDSNKDRNIPPADEEDISASKKTKRKKFSLADTKKPHSRIKRDFPAGLSMNLDLLSGCKILVAEDNEINQKVLKAIFKGHGINLIIVPNGKDALDILAFDSSFDIILMDVNMPIMDGLEATKAIRENTECDDIPIIALTGDVAADDIRKIKEAGMDDFLAKPIDKTVMFEKLYTYGRLASESQKKTSQKLATLNIEFGLESANKDQQLHKELLKDFVSQMNNVDSHISLLREKQDFEALLTIVFNIMDICRNIGAERLANKSKSFFNAIKKQDKTMCDKIIREFNAVLVETLTEVRNVLIAK